MSRADGSHSNLRSAAYEALMELVKNSPKVDLASTRTSHWIETFDCCQDCYGTVQETMVIILQRLNAVLTMHVRLGFI